MVRLIFTLILIWFCHFPPKAQTGTPSLDLLSDLYPNFQEGSISTKRFGIEDLIPIFNRLNTSSDIEFSVKSKSLEGRPIFLARYGQGDTPLLFWSQMHGDESTATMALLDLFNFFNSDEPELQSFLNMIREKLTLYFIPMLNPDGAARFQRRNAANIDLNRDAIRLANPESMFLKKMRDSLNPVFGFNLHDQSIFYRAGLDGHQVAMAFLAPAFDHEKNIDGVRMKSMQLITILCDSLSLLIPDRIGVYDDSFEPRAFGDNIQRWGTSTILIESGGYPNDPEKQYLRKLNFLTIIKALESILNHSYEEKTIQDYNAIPPNDRKMMSLVIRDLEIPVEGQMIRMDVGYQYGERVLQGKTRYLSSINDVGDLSVYNGFEEFQAMGFKAEQGRWYENAFKNMRKLKESNWKELIRKGYLGFIVKKPNAKGGYYPIELATGKPEMKSDPLNLVMAPGRNPTFILKNNEDRYIVFNGKVMKVEAFLNLVKAAFDEQK